MRWMRWTVWGGFWLAVLVPPAPAQQAAEPPPVSEQTEECLGCHESDTPGIVADWRTSRHARTSPAMALARPPLERRLSATDVPVERRGVAVGCFECHGLNPERHQDNFEHFGFRINTVVSPNDCRTCHPTEAGQYLASKKAFAVDNLEQNPLYHTLVETITATRTVRDGRPVPAPTGDNTRNKTCFACHGTRVEAKGLKTVVVDGDELRVPNLTNWPNQGVGRINPDGTQGSCAACHSRHGFSIEMARKPYTCAQCHLAPDVPAWEVYRESKHGNLFSTHQAGWNFDAVPWRVGTDFRAPTCAACHMALLAAPDGEPIVQRNHDFGGRLWVRIFGLITSHPQPKYGGTFTIRNAEGLPLPTTLDGKPALEHLIDAAEQARRQGEMKKVCLACHGTSWADGHFAQMARLNADTDKMVLAATDLVKRAWELKLADPANPFDEAIERKWVTQWLFYANSVRYSGAMGGPDYAAFKYGWWDLTRNLEEMADSIELKAKARR